MAEEPPEETVPLSVIESPISRTNSTAETQRHKHAQVKKLQTMAKPSRQSLIIVTSTLTLAVAMIVFGVIWFDGRGASHASPVPYQIKSAAGIVKGEALAKAGYKFVAYKSIPFAKPPLGALRFKRPVPLDSSSRRNTFINTGDYKKSCWSVTQKSTSKYYGEDCLYLNVFTPDGEAGPLPVMVWLHGGGFVAGSTFPEPGKMVDQGKVIVVTVNYRLSVLGFLTTEDDDFPSNNGLWDQYLAIKWVYENIQYFHGDSSSITVFGESAGAMSTALHVLSPLSSRYFHKAILQSGAMTSAISRNPQAVANKFAELVGCTDGSGDILKDCLRNVSDDNILKFSKSEWYASSLAQRQLDFVWTPVIDGEFILDDPSNLINNITFLEQLKVYEKQYIIGVVNNEGALLTDHFIYPMPVSVISNSTFFRDLVDVLLRFRYTLSDKSLQKIGEQVRTFYTGGSQLTNPPNPISVFDLAGDVTITVPAVEAALAFTNNLLSKKAKTFFYQFDYCPETPELQAPCFGHGQEVGLEFPRRNITDPVQSKLSDLFISLLTRFAKSSDPETVLSCGWPKFDSKRRQYLRISPSSDVRSHLYNNRILFWLKTIPCSIYGGGVLMEQSLEHPPRDLQGRSVAGLNLLQISGPARAIKFEIFKNGAGLMATNNGNIFKLALRLCSHNFRTLYS
ncbi:carboxylic ester hydrolase [Plakobranchus ocellatus]|uniref:Carboxylic ester hydrolase n=1 Tax=Plakobranchus ocellatus TaxID=259542 RepID=A0AAV4BR90_9GAST|nr:carboxylic ester hydrolase [Plakobranchus ocellatus]